MDLSDGFHEASGSGRCCSSMFLCSLWEACALLAPAVDGSALESPLIATRTTATNRVCRKQPASQASINHTFLNSCWLRCLVPWMTSLGPGTSAEYASERRQYCRRHVATATTYNSTRHTFSRRARLLLQYIVTGIPYLDSLGLPFVNKPVCYTVDHLLPSRGI